MAATKISSIKALNTIGLHHHHTAQEWTNYLVVCLSCGCLCQHFAVFLWFCIIKFY